MTSTPLKFYADVHVAKSVVVQLRNKGVDIVHCEELDMADASDLQHLALAVEQKRTLITRDKGFLTYHSNWLEEGKSHSGIFFLSRDLQGKKHTGTIVKALLDYHELIAGGAGTVEADIANQFIWIN